MPKNVVVVATVWLDAAILVREGDVYEADHPLVLKHPSAFRETDATTNPVGDPPIAAPPVESATAEPGEKRTTTKRTVKK